MEHICDIRPELVKTDLFQDAIINAKQNEQLTTRISINVKTFLK